MNGNLLAGLIIAGVQTLVSALLLIPYCRYVQSLDDKNDEINMIENVEGRNELEDIQQGDEASTASQDRRYSHEL